jgi:SAM-dependent methyltransferase
MPLTALNTCWRFLDKSAKSILDVGCGKGEPMKFINRSGKFYTVGLDIFKPYLMKAKREGTHNDYILCDVRRMPIRSRSVDVVIGLEIIEHLNRHDSEVLIENMEHIARKQVIITTPVGFSQQDKLLLLDGNPWQVHRSGWCVDDMRERGYMVKGSTLYIFAGKAGDINFPRHIKLLGYMLWMLTSFLAYFYPKLAADMICIKNLN